jgi:hypothetical protein
LSFAFAVHLLAAPSMGLLVGIILWIAYVLEEYL